MHFPPEPASLAFESGALAGKADVLAREPAADNIDRSNVRSPQGSDILKDRNRGPVLSEDGSAVGFDLAEGGGSHTRTLQPKGKSTDAGKEIEDTHHHFTSCPMNADQADRASASAGKV